MSTAHLTHQQKIQDFLAQKRIAVTGLSRTKDSGAGAIYLKLRDHGYQVFPVHPEAEIFHGDACYPKLSAIPGGVDAVFIMNSPDVTEKIVDEALRLGIKRVWMHNNTIAGTSVSKAAVTRCREAGVNVISVGCPMMFLDADFFHKGMGWLLKITGRMKEPVS
jgi:predicted CoA-binding protein